jgi:hypothetical protein
MRQGCSFSLVLFNTVPKFLATIRRKEKEIKEIKTGKKEMK